MRYSKRSLAGVWHQTGSDVSLTKQYPKTIDSPLPPVYSSFSTLRIFTFASSRLRTFYTPDFPHSSFKALLTVYIQQFLHSALHVSHRNLFWLQSSPFKSLFCSQIDNRKQRKAFLQDLLDIFLEFTPNTTSVKDYYFGPKARSDAFTVAG